MPGDRIEKRPNPDEAKDTELKAIVDKTWRKLSFFLNQKTRLQQGSIGFSIDFEAMALNLDLPRSMSLARKIEIMDRAMLSTPGMGKTATGYTVTDPDLLLENFGPGANSRKLMQVLSAEPDKIFISQEIADILSMPKETVRAAIRALVADGKVVVVEAGGGGDPMKIKIKR